MRARWGSGFRHNEHSLRVVEDRTAQPDRAGTRRIWHHTGRTRPTPSRGDRAPLDRVAYINDDIDDAIRAGVLRFEDLPPAEIQLPATTGSDASRRWRGTCCATPRRRRHRPGRGGGARRCCASLSSCSSGVLNLGRTGQQVVLGDQELGCPRARPTRSRGNPSPDDEQQAVDWLSRHAETGDATPATSRSTRSSWRSRLCAVDKGHHRRGPRGRGHGPARWA